MKRLSGDWQEHSFHVAGFAIWRAATNVRMLTASRIALESILKTDATFLRPSDFE